MIELASIAEHMLVDAQRRLEIAAANLANARTPGFKQTTTFAQSLNDAASLGAVPRVSTQPVLTSGSLSATGRTLDLALAGDGFFTVKNGAEMQFTRAGRFERATDGRVVTADGLTLQTRQGGDLVLSEGDIEILPSGLVLEDGTPIAQIGIQSPTIPNALVVAGSGVFVPTAGAEMEPVENPQIQQGMLEESNVDWSTQMTQLMALQRQMEVGAQLSRTYDSLLGQAATTFARGGRQ